MSWSWFSPIFVWVVGIKLRPTGLHGKGIYPPSHLHSLTILLIEKYGDVNDTLFHELKIFKDLLILWV